jgi:hypothetical protein
MLLQDSEALEYPTSRAAFCRKLTGSTAEWDWLATRGHKARPQGQVGKMVTLSSPDAGGDQFRLAALRSMGWPTQALEDFDPTFGW